jgi:hypothetical protein
MVPSGWNLENLCPSASIRRGLTLGLAFIVFGSMACMSGLALLVDDRDPRSAFTTEQPASRAMTTTTATIEQPAVDTAMQQKVTMVETPDPCRSDADGKVNVGCGTAARQETDTVHADTPAMAETAGPAAVPEQVRLLASTPAPTEETLKSTDAPASVAVSEPTASETAPPQAAEASPAKPQKAQRRQSRQRNLFDAFPLFAFDQRGRPRVRPLFW